VLLAASGCSGSVAPKAQDDPVGLQLEKLPREGVAVEVARRLKPELILVGLDGRAYGRPKLALDSDSQLYRNVVVLRKPGKAKRYVLASSRLRPYRRGSYPRALDLRPGAKCGTFARRGDRRYLLCSPLAADNPTRIEVADGRSRQVVAGPPPHARRASLHIGYWRDAYLSPDGKTVLAVWSVECESPTAFFESVRGEDLRPVTGEHDWRKAPESVGLGWTKRGLAVVQLFAGECGNGYPKPGIYLVNPHTGAHWLVYAVSGAFAVMWRR
jgi:hypothetical protein